MSHTFTRVVSLSKMLHYFACIQISIWQHPSAWRTFFNISHSAGLLDSLSFESLPSYLKDIFTVYQMLCYQWFILMLLRCSIVFLACIVSVIKSIVILIFIPLYVLCLSSLAVSKVFFFIIGFNQNDYDIPSCGFPFLTCLGFIELLGMHKI